MSAPTIPTVWPGAEQWLDLGYATSGADEIAQLKECVALLETKAAQYKKERDVARENGLRDRSSVAGALASSVHHLAHGGVLTPGWDRLSTADRCDQALCEDMLTIRTKLSELEEERDAAIENALALHSSVAGALASSVMQLHFGSTAPPGWSDRSTGEKCHQALSFLRSVWQSREMDKGLKTQLDEMVHAPDDDGL